MNDCNLCKNYYEEIDVNFADCKKNCEDKYWFGNIECSYFEDREV